MASVIKHALRADAGMQSSFHPEGWNPKLKVTLRGPAPAGAELVWAVRRPGGSDWFELRERAPELDDELTATIDLQRWDIDSDIDEGGTAAFTLRLVSESAGVDELLHDGSMSVVPLGGHRYAVDHDWLLPLAFLCLDTVEEHEAPRLKVTTFHKGDVGAYSLEAHCLYEGEQVAQASYVQGGHTFTANDGRTVGLEAIAEFDDVRGWSTLADQGGGDHGWHRLDVHDGRYQVRVVRESTVVRVVAFEVAGGRIVPPGAVESAQWTGPVILADARVLGDLDGEWCDEGEPFYGDATTAAAWTTIDEVYQLHRDKAAEEAPYDEDTMAALRTWYGEAERLVRCWESDLVDAAPPYSSELVHQAEVVVWAMGGFRALRDAVSAVPDDHRVEHEGHRTTVGALTARVLRIGEAAQSVIDLAPRPPEDDPAKAADAAESAGQRR